MDENQIGLDEVHKVLRYIDAEWRDGMSRDELCREIVRFLTNRAMDLETLHKRT